MVKGRPIPAVPHQERASERAAFHRGKRKHRPARRTAASPTFRQPAVCGCAPGAASLTIALKQVRRDPTCAGATWRSGYAAVCKTVYPGSIPGVASTRKINDLAYLHNANRGIIYLFGDPLGTRALRARSTRAIARLTADVPAAGRVRQLRGAMETDRHSLALDRLADHFGKPVGRSWLMNEIFPGKQAREGCTTSSTR